MPRSLTELTILLLVAIQIREAHCSCCPFSIIRYFFFDLPLTCSSECFIGKAIVLLQQKFESSEKRFASVDYILLG